MAITAQAAPPAPIGAAPRAKRAKVAKVASGDTRRGKRAAARLAREAAEAAAIPKLQAERARFLAEGAAKVLRPQGGGRQPVAKEVLSAKIDARVADGITSKVQAAEWYAGMTDGKLTRGYVNKKCQPKKNKTA